MAFALERFGWDGLTVPAELKNICHHLPTAANLKLLRQPQIMCGAEVYFPFNFFHSGTEKYMPAYMRESKINDGGYASIYKGKRAIFRQEVDEHSSNVLLKKQGSFEPTCIKKINLNILPEEDAQTPRSRAKTYDDEVNAILYEAYIHALICKLFETAGYPDAVPTLHEVCAVSKDGTNSVIPTNIDSIWLVMELLKGTTLEKFFQRNLQVGRAELNDSLVLDVIIQIAFYMKILQDNIYFNHRDMKINNVFVRLHDAPWTRTITIPTLGVWRCKSDVVLIDYGFACLASGPGTAAPASTLLGAGSWFCQDHDCLKYGRDLGQFLYSIHCQYPFEKYLSPWLVLALRSVLIAKKGNVSVDILKGFDSDGTPRSGALAPVFNDGIYHFLRDNAVDIPGCKPAAFLKTITEAFKARP